MRKIKRIKSIITITILIIIALLVSLRTSTSIINKTSYISTDVSVWINIAKLMDDGKIMYADFFDHKGPALYVLYFLGYKLFGLKLGIWILEYICTLTDAIMIFLTSKKITKSSLKSIFVASISMLLLSFLCLENPCSESLAIPFVLIALNQFVNFFMEYDKKFRKKESIVTRNLSRYCYNDKTKSNIIMDCI